MTSQSRIWTFLTMCLVIQGTVTCVSGRVSDLTSLQLEGAQQQCIEWTSLEDTKTMLRNVSRQLACPCNNQLIQYDINFRKNGRCYEEFFFQDGIKLICCYSESGLLTIKGAGGSYILHANYQQSIKLLHKLCCLNEATCTLFYETVPFENCKNYQSPAVARAWGDAHIQPVAGETYDFDGHGEYIFLDVDEGAFVIQCRLEYISQENTDATILTAFALKVNGSKPLEVMLNRTTGKIIYNNTNDGQSPFMIPPPQLNNTQLQVGVRTEHFSATFRFNGGDDLTITLVQRIFRSHIVKGLAGNTTDGYMLGNGTIFSKEANATLIYDFGQSWRLSNLSESIFLYNDDWTFTYYNRNVTKPRFPDDYLNNITSMFTTFGNHNETEIQGFQNLCNVDNEIVKNRCLLSIARTNNIVDAKTVINNYYKELNRTNTFNIAKDLKPQFIKEFPNDTRLKLNLNTTFVLEVSQYVQDNDTNETLTYDVTTEGNITIDKNTGTLTLYVDETLRDYKGSIFVGVTDKWGNSDHQNLQIQFCGCERPSQCLPFTGVKSDTSSESNVQQTQCDCGKYFQGSFCEIKLDVCNITKCYLGVTCDETTDIIDDDTNPCGSCPKGHSGDGKDCKDNNECKSKTSNCQQNCTNTVGSFTCSCENGYNKSGSSCQDIDECIDSDKCEKESYTECVNTLGSFSCACIDDYSRDASGKCSYDTGRYVYIGLLNLTLSACGIDVELEELSLKKHLHLLRPINDTDFANVELISRTSIKGSARENVIFGLHSYKNLNWMDVQSKLDKNPDIHWNITTTTTHGSNCTVVGDKHLFKETDNMLCKTLDKNKCDETTTRCKQQNGESLCECQEGYKHKGSGPTNLCYDVDECATNGFNCSDNGNCKNTFGNWTCDCAIGYATKYSNYRSIICEDIDECNDSSKYVCQNGTCSNSIGSWECICNTGYEEGILNGKIICKDVDECSGTSIDDSCTSTHGTCTNTEGNWTCHCLKGYQAIHYNYENITCEDIDECQVNNECVHGTCTNIDGGFDCECPDNLATKVQNASGITICTGLNHYQSNMTISTKELTKTEKNDIATRLEIEIQIIYKEKYKDVSVIVTVTIVQVNKTSRVKKRAADTPTTTFQYKAVTNTYLNESKDVDEMSYVLQNKTTVLIDSIQRATNISLVVGAKAFSLSKVITTTTTMKPPNTTPACNINCQNGGTCVTENGVHQTCRCPQSYQGDTCEVHVVEQLEDPTNDKDTTLYASVGSLGGLIIVMAIVIVVVCRRASIKPQKAKDEMYMDGVSNTNNTVSMPRGNEYVSTEEMTTAFDRTASQRFSEPKPNYGPQQTFVRPGNRRDGSPNTDYHTERRGSPKQDYNRSGSPTMRRSRDEPSISDTSRDSGMDISKGSISMDRHNGNHGVDNPLYAEGDSKPPRVVSSHL